MPLNIPALTQVLPFPQKLVVAFPESSYRKGGIHVCIGEQEVSKETVMKKLHALEFPALEPLEKKRKVRRLYIDADEDHVSLQYLEKKGDIRKPRTNTMMPKLIYVYEDVDYDGSKHELVHCSFFGGDYAGTEETRKLWQGGFGLPVSAFHGWPCIFHPWHPLQSLLSGLLLL